MLHESEMVAAASTERWVMVTECSRQHHKSVLMSSVRLPTAPPSSSGGSHMTRLVKPWVVKVRRKRRSNCVDGAWSSEALRDGGGEGRLGVTSDVLLST